MEACRLSKYDDYRYLDTLANAYAANGKFDDAIKAERLAIVTAVHQGKAFQDGGPMLELFENKAAYVGPLRPEDYAREKVNLGVENSDKRGDHRFVSVHMRRAYHLLLETKYAQ